MIGDRGLEVYDIANNQITRRCLHWHGRLDSQFAGIAPIQGPGSTDLVLRNVNTGAFEVYHIGNNQLMGAGSLGQVGLESLRMTAWVQKRCRDYQRSLKTRQSTVKCGWWIAPGLRSGCFSDDVGIAG